MLSMLLVGTSEGRSVPVVRESIHRSRTHAPRGSHRGCHFLCAFSSGSSRGITIAYRDDSRLRSAFVSNLGRMPVALTLKTATVRSNDAAISRAFSKRAS